MIGFPNLGPDDIEVRVQQVTEKGCSLLLYKDARCDMRILDETVGAENWDCSYERIGDGLFCTVGILCQTASGTMTWVYKQDVGTESNMEPTKGEASDAFKRACFKWGIGRELYTAPFVWVDKGMLQKHYQDQRTSRWVCRDKFHVKSVEIGDGRITDLLIESDKGLVVYRMWHMHPAESETAPQKPSEGRYDEIKRLKAEAVSMGIAESGIDSWIEATFKKPKKELDGKELKVIEGYIATLINDKKALQDG